MASPQKENGFTPISNELFESIYRLKINIDAMRIILFIMRKTYGWKKKRDKIALSQFVNELSMKRQHVCRNLNKLYDMKIILRIQDDSGNEYEINKNYEKWEVVPKQGRPQTGNKVVPKQVTHPVPKQGHTKETIQKKTKGVENFSEKIIPLTSLKTKSGKAITLVSGEEYVADGWSPKQEMDMRRRIVRALGEKKSTVWSQLLFGSAWDFKKAFYHFQGREYLSPIIVEQTARTLAVWYEAGETRETIREMILAYFTSQKAKDLTITPTTVFSPHTYETWKQGKLISKDVKTKEWWE